MERRTKRTDVEIKLGEYLQNKERFITPPEIRLKLISKDPDNKEIDSRSIAISTAIQCYAPGVAKMVIRESEKELDIGKSTLDGGHHTTRMHTNFTFQFVGVSRSVTHDIFHATPFYNTEQQSQRYVEAKMGSYVSPRLNEEQQIFFEQACNFSNSAYFEMATLLKPEVEKRVRDMNPSGGWKVEETKKRLEDKVGKLTQEIARNVLPIGQKTNYFYTVNELQLLRLFQASQMQNFTHESKLIIAEMINQVAKHDPTIIDELDKPNDFTFIETNSIDSNIFDHFLQGKNSKLINSPSFVGFGRNLNVNIKLLADVYETGMFDPTTSMLREMPFVFATKLSHAGDSQRQRHRRTSSNVYDVNTVYNGKVDFQTPLVVKESPHIRERYEGIINRMFNNSNTALKMGIPKEFATLLLPNALTIRLVENGDAFDWIHRWKQRLCYLAQEEIFFVSIDQVKEIKKSIPELSPVLSAPCGIRKLAGVSPRCPEGSRWCGQPVFNWDLDEYEKHRLI